MSSFRNYGRHSMNLAASMEQDRLQGWLNVANVENGEFGPYVPSAIYLTTSVYSDD